MSVSSPRSLGSFLFSLCFPLHSPAFPSALRWRWLSVAPPSGPGDKVLRWQRGLRHVELKAALSLGRRLPLATL